MTLALKELRETICRESDKCKENDRKISNFEVKNLEKALERGLELLSSDTYLKTEDEKLSFTKRYIKSDYNNIVYRMILDETISKNRTFEERLSLIDEYINSNSNRYICSIIININVLENRSFEQQLTFIKIYKDSNYNNGVHAIMVDKNVLKYRSFEEQLILINKYIESNYNHNIYMIITNEIVLESQTFKKQLDLINEQLEEIKEKVEEDKNESKPVDKNIKIYTYKNSKPNKKVQ